MTKLIKDNERRNNQNNKCAIEGSVRPRSTAPHVPRRARFGRAWRAALLRERIPVSDCVLCSIRALGGFDNQQPAAAEEETSRVVVVAAAHQRKATAHQNSNKREILSRLTKHTFFQVSPESHPRAHGPTTTTVGECGKRR